ncbi:hypothetical protein [Ochrobactrum chromiisoli]|uniref:Uncharacterized protein n=1 Tax=Ochrobactrum chromiisoli TaxID=2993941 RepID=A0ABT3QRE9_9HYPH|nr:hypothetical protein [Ochrobactrum chromiisoli]MCX2698174.1 hypothetical protein [Ochrobactrum chromiisoli]
MVKRQAVVDLEVEVGGQAVVQVVVVLMLERRRVWDLQLLLIAAVWRGKMGRHLDPVL